MKREVARNATSLASGWITYRCDSDQAVDADATIARTHSVPAAMRCAGCESDRRGGAGGVMRLSMHQAVGAPTCVNPRRNAVGRPRGCGVVSTAMTFAFGGFFTDVVLPLVAIALAIGAYRAARRRPPAPPGDERIAALEEQVRGLLYRVWTLERTAAERPPQPAPETAVADDVVEAPPREHGPAVESVTAASFEEPAFVPAAHDAPLAAGAPARAVTGTGSATAESAITSATQESRTAPAIDLEQRIGARWATWVGIVAILFAVSFFLKWSFDNDLVGPRARVAMGVAAGALLLLAGLALHRRRDVPYLSPGLAGLGLGVLYLSLWAGYALYALLRAPAAFAAMFAVTILGALVSVASSRQITAALAVLGGLLTPLLLRVERPDEGNLLVYLIVLDFLVLAVARFRSWPSLTRLAWAGSVLLYAPVFLRTPIPSNPLTRLVLLSGLFLLFLAVPLLRERAGYRRIGEVDLALVIGNAAGYFWAVYATLGPWHPSAEAPWALALAIVYRAAAADYEARVHDDRGT